MKNIMCFSEHSSQVWLYSVAVSTSDFEDTFSFREPHFEYGYDLFFMPLSCLIFLHLSSNDSLQKAARVVLLERCDF